MDILEAISSKSISPFVICAYITWVSLMKKFLSAAGKSGSVSPSTFNIWPYFSFKLLLISRSFSVNVFSTWALKGFFRNASAPASMPLILSSSVHLAVTTIMGIWLVNPDALTRRHSS